MARKDFLTAALLPAVLFWTWNSGAAAVEITTVVKTGDLAPGAGGAVFDDISISVPVVNGAGAVAFKAGLTGSGITMVNDQGIWAGQPGALRLVARKGAPATGSAAFGDFDFPVLAGDGSVAFLAELQGSGVNSDNDQGIWAGHPSVGNLPLVARKGDLAPGAGGAVFDRLSRPVMNGNSQVAFLADLRSGAVTSSSLWLWRFGAPTLVARVGGPAPDTGGAVFADIKGPVLNGAGELAFFGALSGGGVIPGVNDQGLWVGPPGGFTLLARRGAPAPGASGAIFDDLSTPDLNGAGEVLFRADLEGSGVTEDNNRGIWFGTPSDLALVAREGSVAPGVGGAVFDNSFGIPKLNGAGELAFTAGLRGSGVIDTVNDEGLWAGPPGGLVLVARLGDPAPGAGGTVFESFFSTLVLNGAGELAFRALVGGAGVTFANDQGLWAGPPGGLQLLARAGNTIEVAPSDFRTVSGNSLSSADNTGNEDGRRSGFSEGGQGALRAEFTDGSSGIFLSPPEPASVHVIRHRAIDDEWDLVMLPRSFNRAIIIAGPPSSRNKAPGTVRLRATSGHSFKARFKEWRYLDDRHPEEWVDFLALTPGRHVMADGSVWEAGIVRVRDQRNWKRKRFKRRFRSPPEVFVTVQAARGNTPVAARVRGVSRTGFEVAIQEEEKGLESRHPRSIVGYIAVFSSRGSGTVMGGVDGTNYRLRQARVNHRFRRVLGERIKLEEERSLDRERRHAKETVSVLTLGRGFFAQQASDKELDTTAIRRR